MHEVGLVKDLIQKVDALVIAEGGKRAKLVKVKIGALAHISGEHLRGHFQEAAAQTYAANAELQWEMGTDLSDPYAQDIILDSLEIEF